jgi:predicted nuclease with TOPRIM domain
MRFLFILYPNPLFLLEVLRLPKEHAAGLDKKLKASGKAHKKAKKEAGGVEDIRERLHAAEKEAAGVEDLRKRLHTAKNSLSKRETEISQREANIIARFEM